MKFQYLILLITITLIGCDSVRHVNESSCFTIRGRSEKVVYRFGESAGLKAVMINVNNGKKKNVWYEDLVEASCHSVESNENL